MVGITPKAFDSIDMILGSFIYKVYAIVHHQVFAIALQRLITPKSVSKIDRAFARMLFNMRHQGFGRNVLNYIGINTPIALQQAKYNALAAAPRPR